MQSRPDEEALRTGEGRPGLAVFLVAVTVALAALMANVDETIVNVAAPVLMVTFRADTGQISLISLAYLVAMVATILIFGRLSDATGKRRVFIAGFSLFSVASALCGLAPSLPFLVLFRFLQGVGGAALFSTTGAIVVTELPARHQGKAFGLISVFAGAGAALGAPAGGFILHHADWRWIFFINVPIGLVSIALAWTLLADDAKPLSAMGPFDAAGAALSFGAVVLLVVALNRGDEWGWTSPRTVGAAVLFAVLAAAFVARERRCRSPLIDLSLLARRDLACGLGARGLVTGSLAGMSFLFPFYLQTVRGVRPDRAGLLLAVSSLTMVLAAPVGGVLTDRLGASWPARLSGVATAASASLFLLFDATTSRSLVVLAFALYGAGLGVFFTANIKVVMSQGEKGTEGALTAANAFNSFLSTALGIVVFESVYSFGLTGAEGTAEPPGRLLAGFLRAAVLCLAASAVAAALSFAARERGSGPAAGAEPDKHHEEDPWPKPASSTS